MLIVTVDADRGGLDCTIRRALPPLFAANHGALPQALHKTVGPTNRQLTSQHNAGRATPHKGVLLPAFMVNKIGTATPGSIATTA